ncbi:Uncharacterized protein PBTT_00059 [Plasmodiophora brassicae]
MPTAAAASWAIVLLVVLAVSAVGPVRATRPKRRVDRDDVDAAGALLKRTKAFGSSFAPGSTATRRTSTMPTRGPTNAREGMPGRCGRSTSSRGRPPRPGARARQRPGANRQSADEWTAIAAVAPLNKALPTSEKVAVVVVPSTPSPCHNRSNSSSGTAGSGHRPPRTSSWRRVAKRMLPSRTAGVSFCVVWMAIRLARRRRPAPVRAPGWTASPTAVYTFSALTAAVLAMLRMPTGANRPPDATPEPGHVFDMSAASATVRLRSVCVIVVLTFLASVLLAALLATFVVDCAPFGNHWATRFMLSMLCRVP